MSKLDKKFVTWFYDEVYAEPNHNRNGWMHQYCDINNPDHRNFWMREAYMAGAVEGRRLAIYLLKLELYYHLDEQNFDEAECIERLIFKLENTTDYPKS